MGIPEKIAQLVLQITNNDLGAAIDLAMSNSGNIDEQTLQALLNGDMGVKEAKKYLEG